MEAHQENAAIVEADIPAKEDVVTVLTRTGPEPIAIP